MNYLDIAKQCSLKKLPSSLNIVRRRDKSVSIELYI